MTNGKGKVEELAKFLGMNPYQFAALLGERGIEVDEQGMVEIGHLGKILMIRPKPNPVTDKPPAGMVAPRTPTVPPSLRANKASVIQPVAEEEEKKEEEYVPKKRYVRRGKAERMPIEDYDLIRQLVVDTLKRDGVEATSVGSRPNTRLETPYGKVLVVTAQRKYYANRHSLNLPLDWPWEKVLLAIGPDLLYLYTRQELARGRPLTMVKNVYCDCDAAHLYTVARLRGEKQEAT